MHVRPIINFHISKYDDALNIHCLGTNDRKGSKKGSTENSSIIFTPLRIMVFICVQPQQLLKTILAYALKSITWHERTVFKNCPQKVSFCRSKMSKIVDIFAGARFLKWDFLWMIFRYCEYMNITLHTRQANSRQIEIFSFWRILKSEIRDVFSNRVNNLRAQRAKSHSHGNFV